MIFSFSGLQSENTSLKVENVDLTGMENKCTRKINKPSGPQSPPPPLLGSSRNASPPLTCGGEALCDDPNNGCGGDYQALCDVEFPGFRL